MKRPKRYVLGMLLGFLVCAGRLSAQAAQHVDPFLGADAGGNVFVGPSVPFGMVKPGPDMDAGENDENSGWAAHGDIRGFSQTHVSGTGGGAKYGNIRIQPTTGAPSQNDYASPRGNEHSEAGYYRVTLTRFPIDVEVTASRRTALYRMTYPNSEQANILFDVGKCLHSSAEAGEAQSVVGTQVDILSPTEVAGFSSVKGGWNKQPKPYTVFFYAITDTPARSWGTWQSGKLQPGQKHAAEKGPQAGGGAWLTFPTHDGQQVRMKVGISFVSVEQARRNASTEIAYFNLEEVRAASVAAWNKALGAVELKGETPEQAQMFYTALYHTMLMPVDRTGENPLWKSSEPYYDDYYAIWDTFRTSGPLLTLIAPERERDLVRSLLDIYRHDGWLPDARSGNYNGRTQGGSNAEFLITDAFVKGLKGIDWTTAYAAEVNDAENSPVDQVKEGRGGLEDWRSLGYVSVEGVDRPGSKQMEYAADDFEIALLAEGLGKTADAAKYRARSGNWKNMWDDDLQDGGVKGFIHPRHRAGRWLENFTALDQGSWGSQTFYEGNSWTYSTFVPQDVEGLIQKCGGAQEFVARLDAFFDVPGRYDPGNEPGFLAPYLYIWAGRQDKTAERVRQIIAANFHSGPKGMPFNDDSGAMSSWYAFGVMGIFPNAGQDIYVIGSPALPETTIHLGNGRDFTVIARNVSAENKYVVAAELNGHALQRAGFLHGEISNGGKLVLTMAAKPGAWPTEKLPPLFR